MPETANADKLGLVEMRLPDGRSFTLSVQTDAPDVFHQALAHGELLDSSWRLIATWVRSGETAFDLGANVGVISAAMAMNGARVFSFELLPSNIAHLERTIGQNGLASVEIVPGAVSDAPGELEYGGYSAWGQIVPPGRGSGKARAFRLDDFVSERGVERVDFIKIDIEGWDLSALRGAPKLLSRDRPDIVFESNVLACGNNGYSYRDLFALLSEHGYAFYRIGDGILSPWDGSDLQEVVLLDYLATTRDASEVATRSSWQIRAMTEAEVLRSVLDQDLYGVVHKQYVRAIEDRLPAEIRSDQRVSALLDRWRRDPDLTPPEALSVGAR